MECMVGWVWRTTLEEEGAVVVRRECRSLGSREGGRAPSLESDGDAKDVQGELKAAGSRRVVAVRPRKVAGRRRVLSWESVRR